MMSLQSKIKTQAWVSHWSILSRVVSCFLVWIAISLQAQADFQLTLSSPDAQGTKVPGDILTFNVDLTSTDPFAPLSAVITGIEFDAALLGTPINTTPGSIVPTSNNGALTLASEPGLVSFVYDPIGIAPAPPLFTSAGRLFSFQVQVQPGAQGGTTVKFVDAPGTLLSDAAGDDVTSVGFATLNTTFNLSAVPEPASLGCLALACTGIVGAIRARRRRK